MAITKDEFFDVLRMYAAKEFEDVPTDDSEIDFEFSDEFNKKMEKIHNSGKNFYIIRCTRDF